MIAFDDFESGQDDGGIGWSDAWELAGDARIKGGRNAYSGIRELRLKRSSGLAMRTVDMQGATRATLGFWTRIASFEGSGFAEVMIRTHNDADDITVMVVSDETVGGDYEYFEIDLSGFDVGEELTVIFDAQMSSKSEQWYVDDVTIMGIPGNGDPEVRPERLDFAR